MLRLTENCMETTIDQKLILCSRFSEQSRMKNSIDSLAEFYKCLNITLTDIWVNYNYLDFERYKKEKLQSFINYAKELSDQRIVRKKRIKEYQIFRNISRDYQEIVGLMISGVNSSEISPFFE